MGIDNASEDIGLLSDDDLEYLDGYEELIIDQFNKYPEADIITFQVEGIEAPFKEEYHSSPLKLNYLTSMKVASVEIAVRFDSLKKAGIQFNNLFGAGSNILWGKKIFSYLTV
ncbi:hypothetical protein KHA80_12030 [Anaerobacillus sp. HL2]|nr:hypothetical protein KHA80_12030 [Anaerobacillus sp. HL2]